MVSVATPASQAQGLRVFAVTAGFHVYQTYLIFSICYVFNSYLQPRLLHKSFFCLKISRQSWSWPPRQGWSHCTSRLWSSVAACSVQAGAASGNGVVHLVGLGNRADRQGPDARLVANAVGKQRLVHAATNQFGGARHLAR